jgi:hypothetical protein
VVFLSFLLCAHAIPSSIESSRPDGAGDHPGASVAQTQAPGEENTSWKARFEEICAQTEVATSLPSDQLRKLIRDSHELIDTLSTVEDPSAKVYVFRLKMCLDFFQFALDWQQVNRQDNPEK